jgi:polar amino acid transport system permease protein
VTQADVARILSYAPQLARGAEVTVFASLVAITLSTALATFAAIAHSSTSRGVRTLARVYVELARATPDMVQVYIWYYLLPEFGIVIPALMAGILALGFGHGGSLAEVVRGGIQAVPPTQWDAARVLGMRRWQTWWRIVLPQVARVVLPIWTGYFVSMFKATAFLSLVAVYELMGVAEEIATFNFRFFEVYGIVLVIYAVLGTVAVALIKRLEQHWRIDSPQRSGGQILEEAQLRMA